VNWVRIVENSDKVNVTGNPEHAIINLGDSVKLVDGEYQIGDPEANPLQEGRYVYPAIALPVETKSTFECPSAHLDMLKADMSQVTRLLIIGWRATETHFLELLRQHRVGAISKIAIVAGGSGEAQRVQQNLKPAGLIGRFLQSDDGFTDFVTGQKLNEFLAD